MKLLNLIAFYTLLISGISHTMKMPESRLIQIQKLQTKKYLFNQEQNYFLRIAEIDHTIENNRVKNQQEQSLSPVENITNNKLKLSTIEKLLREKEKQQTLELFKQCGLNEQETQNSINSIQKSYEQYIKFISTHFSTQITENNQSIPHIDIVEKRLNERGFFNDRLSITVKDLKNYTASLKCGCSWDDGAWDDKSLNNIELTLTINPEIINNEHLKSILLHETEHIIEAHPLKTSLITLLVQYFTKNNSIDINKLKEYKDICITHEEEAEVFSAISKPEYASLMRKNRQYSFYSGMLYHSHYEQLAQIDEIHKMIAFLEEHIKRQTNQK